MFISAVRRALRPARNSLKALRHGWRWEKVEFAGIIPLTNGRWSRTDGGQIWQRWNGEGYDYRQLAMMP